MTSQLGIETTTGPLGQGLANAVGMALAEKMLAAHFNRPGFPSSITTPTCSLGDGCMMEGISHEACSLAGTLQLGKLICLYDDNGISIDGEVKGWFRDDTPARFRAYGWQVIAGRGRPRSAGRAHGPPGGTPEHDAADTDLLQDHHRLRRSAPAGHGSHPRLAARRRTRSPRPARILGWTAPPFSIPAAIRDGLGCARAGRRHGKRSGGDLFAAYAAKYPDLAREFERRMKGELPAGWQQTAADAIAKLAGTLRPRPPARPHWTC